MSIVNQTVYSGKDTEGFFSKALLLGASKEAMRLIPNVKSKIKLAQLELGDILQSADCEFSATANGLLEQKTFEVEPVKVNLEFCERTLESSYLSEQMRAGSNNADFVPSSVEDYIIARAAETVSANLEQVIWRGDTASANATLAITDGLLKKMTADAAVVKVVGVTLTASNIIAQVSKLYDAIPAAVEDKTKLFLSKTAAKLYKQAVGAKSVEKYMTGEQELNFLGMEIIVAGGLPANTMVAMVPENGIILTDLTSDMEDIQVLPMKNVTGAPVVRMTTEFKFGVGYLIGAEIVLFA
jgi:hypothetical protein